MIGVEGGTDAPAGQPEPPTPQARLRFIDACRGATMLFVFVSHFGTAYFDEHDSRGHILETLALVASPTFMLVSGLLVGFLYRTRPHDFTRLRVTLAHRGLFLLTIGRVLILAGSWPRLQSVRYLIITDAIGVSMLIAPTLVARVRPIGRLIIAVTLFTASWVAVGFWHPSSFAGRLLLESLFGSRHPSVYMLVFPLVPWCALDLLGSVIGERLGEFSISGDARGMFRTLARTGTVAIAAALVLKLTAVLLATRGGGAESEVYLRGFAILASPGIKFPPSPAYVLFYGGLGLCWLSMWWMAERRGWHRVISPAANLGQASLFMFVLQSYVFFTAIYLLKPVLPFAWVWPMYLVVASVIIMLAAAEWHRRGYRRFVTVGLKSWYNRRNQASIPGLATGRRLTHIVDASSVGTAVAD